MIDENEKTKLLSLKVPQDLLYPFAWFDNLNCEYENSLYVLELSWNS